MGRILNELVTTEDISNSINATKLRKVPGPDGFSATFYKTFKKELLLGLPVQLWRLDHIQCTRWMDADILEVCRRRVLTPPPSSPGRGV